MESLGVSVVVVPPNKPKIRVDYEPMLYGVRFLFISLKYLFLGISKGRSSFEKWSFFKLKSPSGNGHKVESCGSVYSRVE